MNPTKPTLDVTKGTSLKSVDLTTAVFDETEIEVEGRKVFIRAHNPHGFYRISLEHGRLPEKLTGGYTSRSAAEADARKHLAKVA